MKNKGFTLIELLAVIVILAIIALIAVPIVLNIINSARESAKERSRELYSKAVQNAVLKEQLNGDTIKDGHYEKVSDTSICRFENEEATEDCITVEVEGEKPVVYTMEIENGKITSQTIQLKTNDPTYTKEGNGKWTKGGEVNNEQASVTRYYYWGIGSISGELPTTNIDTDVSNITIPYGFPMYIAFDSIDGETKDAVYVCFAKGNPIVEYCIQGGDSGTSFDDNKTILDIAFPSSCHDTGSGYICNSDNFEVFASPTADDNYVYFGNAKSGLCSFSGNNVGCQVFGE